MPESSLRTRLYVDQPLIAGTSIVLKAMAVHYLLRVLRLQAGDIIGVFNGCDGEWRARLEVPQGKSKAILQLEILHRPQVSSTDLWLLFAPIKRARIDFLAEKTTELGASLLQPIMTKRTMVTRINLDRLRSNAIKAAEQTERLDIPEIRVPLSLPDLLKNWPAERFLFAALEAGEAAPLAEAAFSLASRVQKKPPLALLIGPEGGFAPEEQMLLRTCTSLIPVGLGPRLLRADTAALAGLSLLQALLGDGATRPPLRTNPETWLEEEWI